jgi:hypothetical protein
MKNRNFIFGVTIIVLLFTSNILLMVHERKLRNENTQLYQVLKANAQKELAAAKTMENVDKQLIATGKMLTKSGFSKEKLLVQLTAMREEIRKYMIGN